MNKRLVLSYGFPAEDSKEGWERQSVPLGNGYMGANVFGRYDRERIQMTSNQLQNPVSLGGTTSFADIYIELNHTDVENYTRGLDLDKGVAFCRYKSQNVNYCREYFTSYPDDVLAVKLTADKKALSFKLSMAISYLGERASEEGGKEGTVTSKDDIILLRGKLCSRELTFESQMTVVTDGEKTCSEGVLEVKNATYAEIFYVQGTDYKLCPEVFMESEPSKKVFGKDPHEKLTKGLHSSVSKGYDALYERHFADYNELFSRVTLDLGGEAGKDTDILLSEYQESPDNRFIEELYFQFGRYLLISSSRKGTTPASLQGVWSAYDKTPWSGGFWHNINVQMNYWPAFSTNLAETFSAYAEYAEAYRPQAQKAASDYIKNRIPENYTEEEGECGWYIGTAATSYDISAEPGNHSGPGTVGLTSKLFWEYYDFTRDMDVLKNVTYPALLGASKFLTKTVRKYEDGGYRAAFSASPEQLLGNTWVSQRRHDQRYYHTVGCAFDQQMIYENGADFVKTCDILGIKNEAYDIQKEQLDKYVPVRIGYSGQIKEYEEEHFYCEMGEPHHRHISQLVSLSPGGLIGSSTPAWLDAAEKTLDMRGDFSTGWALAHRLCAWARTGDGNRAHTLFKNLLQTRTFPNLWDWHPPFQIDGNFGGVTGVADMLLQSHEGYINILPTLPDVWAKGSFTGLKARGNFTVDCSWENGRASEIKITSCVGGEVKVRYVGIGKATVTCAGKTVTPTSQDDIFLTFNTKVGESYVIKGFAEVVKIPAPTDFTYTKQDNRVCLNWQGEKGVGFKIYRAWDNQPEYILVGETEKTEFADILPDVKSLYNYKVTAFYLDKPLSESRGATLTVHPAGQLEVERYNHIFRQQSM